MVKVVKNISQGYLLKMKNTFHDLQNNILSFDAQGLKSRQITSVHVWPHFCQ
jgi:hypothetical protein